MEDPVQAIDLVQAIDPVQEIQAIDLFIKEGRDTGQQAGMREVKAEAAEEKADLTKELQREDMAEKDLIQAPEELVLVPDSEEDIKMLGARVIQCCSVLFNMKKTLTWHFLLCKK